MILERLDELLLEMFSAAELRRFVARHTPGVVHGLPGDSVSAAQLAHEVVGLWRRNGLPGDGLCDALCGERPAFAARIQAIFAESAPKPAPLVAPSSARRAPPAPAPADDSIGVLHLSDLHVGLDGQSWLLPNVWDVLLADLERLHEAAGPWDVLVFTGDLTQRAAPAEFEALHRRLDQLREHLRALGSDPVLLAVPGNHDLVRPKASEEGAVSLRGWAGNPALQDLFWSNPKSQVRKTINAAFRPWRQHWESRPRDPRVIAYTTGELPGEYAATVEIRGRRLGLLGLNTAALHLWDDVAGRLTLHPKQLMVPTGGEPDRWSRAHDAALLLSHHPSSWLDEASQRVLSGEIYLPNRFVAHLAGHQHAAATRAWSVTGGEDRREWVGSSLFGRETWIDWSRGRREESRIHGYSALRISFHEDRRELRLWPREGVRADDHAWQLIRHTRMKLLADEGTPPARLPPSPRRPEVDPRDPLRAPKPQPRPGVDPPSTDFLDRLMDRSDQWRALRRALRERPGPFIATVYGSNEQNLVLFTERVQRFINALDEDEPAPTRHEVRMVVLCAAGVRCRAPEQIRSRVLEALERYSGGLEAAFRAATAPLLLVLTPGHGPLNTLDQDEREALQTFLCAMLPAALSVKLPHPVRLLIPVEHRHGERAAHRDDLCAWLSGVLARSKLPVVPLDELALPDWPEVRAQLIETFHVTDPAVLSACEACYEAARAEPGITYAELARRLMMIIAGMTARRSPP